MKFSVVFRIYGKPQQEDIAPIEWEKSFIISKEIHERLSPSSEMLVKEHEISRILRILGEEEALKRLYERNAIRKRKKFSATLTFNAMF